MSIHTDGPWFKDEHGRVLLLRGVNLGGSSKVPYTPNGATHLAEGVYDHRNVSFIGRPFPLDEAAGHYARLRAWGLTFLRFLTTWEAVEHAGPGLYDQAYLDYLEEVIGRAADHGLRVFVDFHQDVWSRFSGGDGAPGWTLEAVGFDLPHLAESGAALLHWAEGAAYPQMAWFSNNVRLAAGTMWTLFFAGNDLAPQVRIEGEPAQEFLQRHYLGAMQIVARRLRGRSNVVGYDTLNEPGPGFIGQRDLNVYPSPIRSWYCPTIFQSLLLGAGYPQEVDYWQFGVPRSRYLGKRMLNPRGVRAWRPGHDPIWQAHGVWDIGPDGQPRLLRPDHFCRVGDREVNFYRDYMRPFLKRVAQTVRQEDPTAIIFLESDPTSWDVHWAAEDAPGVVHAAHWYDGLTLVTKNYYPFMGVDSTAETLKVVVGLPGRIRRLYRDNLAYIKDITRQHMGNIPVLIGEFGLPFDLAGGKAYRTGDFTTHVRALDAYCNGMDDNLLSWTIWNYTADNDNQHGDQWNGEDLSIFSRDQQSDPTDINSGGRGLAGFVRPYARAVAGVPMRMSFNRRTGRFELLFRHDPAVVAPTEVYVPRLQYPHGGRVTVSDGEYTWDAEAQLLIYRHNPAQPEHWLRLERL